MKYPVVVKYSLFLLFIVFFISCAAYKPFMAPGFTGDNLTKGGLAVFPALVAEGSQSVPGIQGYLHTAGEELAASLKESQPSLKVVTPSQVSASLASNDLVDDFAKLKDNYAVTGIVDANLAKKIVEPLQVRYFMLPSINSLYASGNSTAKGQLSAKIYDANSAEMVFEAIQNGEATSILGGPPYDKATKNASKALSRVLMKVYKQK
jgi:hypothetical protein